MRDIYKLPEYQSDWLVQSSKIEASLALVAQFDMVLVCKKNPAEWHGVRSLRIKSHLNWQV